MGGEPKGGAAEEKTEWVEKILAAARVQQSEGQFSESIDNCVDGPRPIQRLQFMDPSENQIEPRLSQPQELSAAANSPQWPDPKCHL